MTSCGQRALILCGLVPALWTVLPSAWPASAETAGNAQSPIDLELYGALLERHTRSTQDLVGVRVDYEGLRDRSDWRKLVGEIPRAQPSRLDRDEQMAFWINAYNILTIDLILKHYPVDSIKDIGSFFSPVWNLEVVTIEGKPLSLGEIEHEILRPMGDPRVHAAIVCASTSCPPLARAPFRPESLDEDLSAAMRAWLASDEKGIRIDRTSRRVTVSKIFDWFEEDFEKTGGVLPTIAQYVPARDAEWLRQQGDTASLRYFRYDWSLNDESG